MEGISSTEFDPNDAITQATIVTVLARLAKIDLTQFAGITYEDIEPGRWYTEAAVWAKQSGLLPDYSDFQGTAPFSREQMAVMLVKFLRSFGFDTSTPETTVIFKDADLMDEAVNNAFQVLYYYGIFKGVGGMRMDPAGSTTRAQYTALMHRISALIESR